MKTSEAELVSLLVEGAARRARGEPPPNTGERAAQLVVDIGAHGDSFARVFEGLAAELAKRGLKMPALDDLPDVIAPFALAFGDAFVIDPASDEIDMEATADALDARIEQTLGASPRKLREKQLHDTIRRRVSAQTADIMRANGLTPLADQTDEN